LVTCSITTTAKITTINNSLTTTLLSDCRKLLNY
jgi:hypothetical protein